MNAYSITYFLVIILCSFLIMLCHDKYYKKIIPLFSVIFGLQQFFFLRTNFEIDVTRFYDNMNVIRNIRSLSGYEGVSFFLRNHFDYSTQPLAGLYIAICSLVENNYFLLFLTGLIVSFNILTLMKLVAIDFQIKKIEFITLFLIFFLSYDMFRAISGIRFALVITAFSLIFYLLETKRIRILLFVLVSLLLALIHTSIWLFLIIYLITAIFKNNYTKYILFFFALMFGSINDVVINVLSKLPLPWLSDYLLNKNSRYYESSMYSLGFFVINVLLLLILVLVYVLADKYSENTEKKGIMDHEYKLYYLNILFVILGSYKIIDLQNRSLILLSLLSFPYIVKLFKLDVNLFKDEKKIIQIFLRMTAILIVGVFFLLNSIVLNNFF